ncbi:MAG TPA: energy transducer TonB [Longimicrobiales bacterium]|nr:energy transducer TonB [Longimicrobiales bacterium]
MLLLPIIRTALMLTTTSFVVDTPPSPPVFTKLRSVRNEHDLVEFALLANGVKAPFNLIVPRPENRVLIGRFVRDHYPVSLRTDTARHDMGWVWMFVNEEGMVLNVEIIHSTGLAALDSFMVSIVGESAFEPAQVDGKPVGVWIPYPAQIPHFEELQIEAKQVTPVPSAPFILRTTSPHVKKGLHPDRLVIARMMIVQHRSRC